MRKTLFSSLMGTIIDATNPDEFVAAVKAKYTCTFTGVVSTTVIARGNLGGAFESVHSPRHILESDALFMRGGFELSTYKYVFDESKRVPITRSTMIPDGTERYGPAYFNERVATPIYSVVIRLPETVRAFRKPKPTLEKPHGWDLVENPEEDWF